MKAIILCAGLGKRLHPLTLSMSKHLIPIANKPILFYGLEKIKEIGIKEVGLIVGKTNDDIEDEVGDGSSWGLEVTYILQDDPEGLAHAVKIAQDFLGDEPFVMYLGDNLFKEGLNEFVSSFNSNKPSATILLYGVDNPSQFGIAELKNERIVRVIEKPKKPPTNLAIVGAYIFDKNIFTAIDNIKPSWRNELEITDAIQYLIENDYVVEPHIVKEWWKDTGRPEEIIEANKFMLDYIETGTKGNVDKNSSISGKVLIEEGSEIIDSEIRGPVAIGKNCKIIGSFVGPYTSIGDNALIEKSEIEYSVLMENCTISNIAGRIEDSLLGRNVVLQKSEKKPTVLRLIHGDKNFTELP